MRSPKIRVGSNPQHRTPNCPSSTLLPASAFRRAVQAYWSLPTRFLLVVTIRTQRMALYERDPVSPRAIADLCYRFKKRYRISTSRSGAGQRSGSNQTPLGLHRVAAKIGAGQPIGTVFSSRRPVGLLWQGMPEASIAHRILWLEGLEPGFNRGGCRDSRNRYIYIHGTGNEMTLGKPASLGCIHLSAADLIPLFDRVPERTLVWIEE
ncbi:MAG: L,D-transpeptidase [Verrucomicrobia bacterium]|nr:L,D-transpeptidase [Verrucomicrobiota bacterium]